jgi:tetratricopeptide (TPR) repeat protein
VSAEAAVHALPLATARPTLAAPTPFAFVEDGELALAAVSPAAAARLEHARSWRAHYEGDPMLSIDHEERAVRYFERAGDRRSACEMKVGLAVAYTNVGAYDRAEGALAEALATAERMALARVADLARHNLAFTLARLGRLDEARAVAEHAIARFVAVGDRRLESGTRNDLAQTLARRGAVEEARAEAVAAVACAGSDEEVRAFCSGTLASIELARGRAVEALDAAREAIELVESLGGIEEGEALVRLAHAEALEATGDLAGARVAFGEALAAIHARLARVPDPAWRARLMAVAEHARTFARAAALGVVG